MPEDSVLGPVDLTATDILHNSVILEPEDTAPPAGTAVIWMGANWVVSVTDALSPDSARTYQFTNPTFIGHSFTMESTIRFDNEGPWNPPVMFVNSWGQWPGNYAWVDPPDKRPYADIYNDDPDDSW